MSKGQLIVSFSLFGLILGGVARAHTDCERACENDAVVLFEDCVANLGEDATEDDVEVCRDDARAFRVACRAGCPEDPLNCQNQCQADAAVAFADCVAALGDDPLEDDVDACEEAARTQRNTCDANCPQNCENLCTSDSRQQLADCLAALGEDATEDDEQVCVDDARAARDACRAACPDNALSCENQCQEDAAGQFEDCVAALGDDPTEDDVDLCELDARAARDTCSDACPLDCSNQCREDARQLFDDCVAALGPDPTWDEREPCQDEARAFRDMCRAGCVPQTAKQSTDIGGKSRGRR